MSIPPSPLVPSGSSASAALLRICLLGLAGAPAAATADDPAGRAPIPRCVPQPPRAGVEIGTPSLSSTPLSGIPADLALSGGGGVWLVGSQGQIHHRTHEGAPWMSMESGTTADLRAIQVSLYGGVWVAGEQGTLLHLEGTRWVPRTLPSRADLRDVFFWDEQSGMVVGEGGVFLLTRDGGARWDPLDTGGSRATFSDLVVASEGAPTTVFALGEDGTVLVARAPETGWTVRATPLVGSTRPLQGAFVWQDARAVVLDAAGVAWSTGDGGETWTGALPQIGEAHAARSTDSLRAIVNTSLGAVGVLSSGEIFSATPTGQGVRLTALAPQQVFYPIEAMPPIPPPPPGLDLLDAASGAYSSGLLAVNRDGQILEQVVRQWFEPGHPCGRPFEVAHQSRHAPPILHAGWAAVSTPEPVPDDIPAVVRGALAAAWLRDAQAEHASVASFARFSLRLLALGAPAALLADAQQAMGDEIRHAQRCFALASRYAGQTLAPGPLSVEGALDGPADLFTISVEVLREGAVGETLGAMLATEMRARSQDPQVRQALDEIAADEARHAQMAWGFLRWAVDQGGPPLRQHLRQALEDTVQEYRAAARGPAVGFAASGTRAACWAAHGRLLPREEQRIVRRCLRHIVHPCAEVLLRG